MRATALKLRAQIIIDIDAEDFIAAADHQRRIAQILAELKRDYSQAELSFRERRPRSFGPSAPPMPVRQRTGALHQYEEL
jgi:hypothetical protein